MDSLQIYLQYLFTQDEYKNMNQTIKPKHLQVHILKLKNVIKLKENKVMCDKDMETRSDSESDEAANACWANSMIQSFFRLFTHYKMTYTNHICTILKM